MSGQIMVQFFEPTVEEFLHRKRVRYARPAAEYPDCLPPMFPREELCQEAWVRLDGEWTMFPRGATRDGRKYLEDADDDRPTWPGELPPEGQLK